MWSVFAESLNFRLDTLMTPGREQTATKHDERVYDSSLLGRKAKTAQLDEWNEGELGDSCCFGTRTVQSGNECIWKLHGGV